MAYIGWLISQYGLYKMAYCEYMAYFSWLKFRGVAHEAGCYALLQAHGSMFALVKDPNLSSSVHNSRFC